MSSTATTAESLYQDHYIWLHKWIKRRLNNSHTSADLAKDTFVRILVKQKAFNFDQPQALLTTIAKGILCNWLYRQAIEKAYLEVLSAQPLRYMPSPEQQLESINT